MKLTGQLKVVVFEIVAFISFSWMASRSIVEGYYVLAVAALIAWFGAEYLARNALQEVTSATEVHGSKIVAASERE